MQKGIVMKHKSGVRQKNAPALLFRPFPPPPPDAASLRRRAYHLAGHALLSSDIYPSGFFYLVLFGPSSGPGVRRGEIDILDNESGTLSWVTAPANGFWCEAEWAEILTYGPEIPPAEQATLFAAGCAAERLFDPALAAIADKQAVGDRTCFQRLPASGREYTWERAVEEAARRLTKDRPALDKIAETVAASLQVKRQYGFGTFAIPQEHGEAELFSDEVRSLVRASRTLASPTESTTAVA